MSENEKLNPCEGSLGEDATFKQLVEAMQQGSQEAAWQLTERYSPHILRVVRWSLPNAIRTKLDSHDLLQSVWATLLLEPEKLCRVEDPKNFMGYIAGIAKHKVIDKHRHYSTKKKDVHLEIGDAGLHSGSPYSEDITNPGTAAAFDSEPSPSQAVMVREQWQRVLDRSSDRDHAIVKLRLKGSTYSEIASQLDIDERTVQRSISRMVTEFQE